MMGLSAVLVGRLAVTHTLTGPFVSPFNANFLTDQLSKSDTYTGATSVPVDDQAAYELTLSSGTGTVNLAALPGITAGETVVATGKKVQGVLFVNKATNANKIKIAKGVSTGYGMCASGDDWSYTMSPGQWFMSGLVEAAPDVASGARLWDVTGTGSQVLQIHLIVG